MVLGGGDSLEENFVLASDSDTSSNSDSEEHSTLNTSDVQSLRRNLTDGEDISADEASNQQTKKQKLNWRESSAVNNGTEESQRSLLENAWIAFERFFPSELKDTPTLDAEKINFLDWASLQSTEPRSLRDTLSFLRDSGDLLGEESNEGLNSIFVAGSATRAMYLVKELREFDSSTTPLPLFFHGGGRKKEQASTHKSVLRSNKAKIAVCLPSRLLSISDAGLIDFNKVGLILFDMKTNEKKVNVLSQKDTLKEVMKLLTTHVIPEANARLKIALI